MKKVERIFKNRLFGETDYSAVLSGGDLSGYKLERVDCEPIEVSTGEVCFFDPYSPSGGLTAVSLKIRGNGNLRLPTSARFLNCVIRTKLWER